MAEVPDGRVCVRLSCEVALISELHAVSTGGGLTSKRGVFGNLGKPETMMSVCYGRGEDLVFSGAATGDVYIWKEVVLLKTIKAHDGPVFAMYSLDKVWMGAEHPDPPPWMCTVPSMK